MILGLTDLLQPVDAHVAAKTKKLMAALYKVELELNYEEWRNHRESGALSAQNRRMLMARWLSTAWAEVTKNPYLLESSFKHTVLVKLDGTHELKYRGLPGYEPPKYPCAHNSYTQIVRTVCDFLSHRHAE